MYPTDGSNVPPRRGGSWRKWLFGCSMAGLGGLVAVTVFIWWAFHEPPSVDAVVHSPSSAQVGEQFRINVEIRNGDSSSHTLTAFVLDDSYLRGVAVEATEPAYVQTSHGAANPIQIYDTALEIRSGETKTLALVHTATHSRPVRVRSIALFRSGRIEPSSQAQHRRICGEPNTVRASRLSPHDLPVNPTGFARGLRATLLNTPTPGGNCGFWAKTGLFWHSGTAFLRAETAFLGRDSAILWRGTGFPGRGAAGLSEVRRVLGEGRRFSRAGGAARVRDGVSRESYGGSLERGGVPFELAASGLRDTANLGRGAAFLSRKMVLLWRGAGSIRAMETLTRTRAWHATILRTYFTTAGCVMTRPSRRHNQGKPRWQR